MSQYILISLAAAAGWYLAHRLSPRFPHNFITDILTGVSGCLAGGFFMIILNHTSLVNVTFYNFVLTLTGACVSIYIGRLLRR